MLDDTTLARTDTWSDVYGVGVLLYRMLTGRQVFPFDADTSDRTAYARSLLNYISRRTTFLDADLRRPADVSAAVWTIVACALRQNPKQRFPNATAMAGALESFLATGHVTTFEGPETEFSDVPATTEAPPSDPAAPAVDADDTSRTLLRLARSEPPANLEQPTAPPSDRPVRTARRSTIRPGAASLHRHRTKTASQPDRARRSLLTEAQLDAAVTQVLSRRMLSPAPLDPGARTDRTLIAVITALAILVLGCVTIAAVVFARR
jgi:hypothetical protein